MLDFNRAEASSITIDKPWTLRYDPLRSFARDAFMSEPYQTISMADHIILTSYTLTSAFRFPSTESGVKVLRGVFPPSFFISA